MIPIVKGKKRKKKRTIERVKERITHFLTAISGVEIGISYNARIYPYWLNATL